MHRTTQVKTELEHGWSAKVEEALMVAEHVPLAPCERPGETDAVSELEFLYEQRTKYKPKYDTQIPGFSNLIPHGLSRLRATCSSASVYTFRLLSVLH